MATPNSNHSTRNANRVGFYAALLLAVITLVTFGFAMIAIPISGANCPGDCATYPYLDTVSQFPRDFLWMYLAVIMLSVYVILMAAIHTSAGQSHKIYSQIALSFAIIAALILLSDYFVQFSVIPISLMGGETEGIPLLIQYNPHGVFIALEELGYLMMSLSFLFAAPVFAGRSRLEAAIRWIFGLSFVLVILALLVIAIVYGLNRLDRFEVVVISINWLVLIANGVLLSIYYRRKLAADPDGA